MWKTIILLLLTILVLPVAAFILDEPLTPEQSEILTTLVVVYLVAAILCFIVSTLSKNYSQVDKLWSLLPLAYLWLIASGSDFDPRITLMSIMVTAWGLRLTYNFARRGGYSVRFWAGEEDYRWALLRAKPELSKPWAWMLFNLFFISLYQMGLVLLIKLPALRSVGGRELSAADYLLAAAMLALIIIETIADQQQWNYHKEKMALKESGKELPEYYRKGFVHKGLWARSRHPNYAAEQAIWIVFYFFSVTATGSWLNWSLTGAALLVLLFRGSSDFSEAVSGGKYPLYAEYKSRVRRFI